MPLVNQLLLSLYILEHVCALRDGYVIGEYLRVVIIELKHSGQALVCLFDRVEPLKILRKVVKDDREIEFESEIKGLLELIK